jgi:hypothetical protein
MATLPTRILEIEFDAGVWTNVTADMVAITSRRGRNRESGAFETGSFTFTLRNDARKYDPENTAGTYYGKLRPNRRVRLRATYSAVTYDVFVGYIDRISQVSGGPNDATALFEASDFFKLLNRVELPRSVYVTEVAADTPTLWWQLDEPSGSATVTDVVVHLAGTVLANTTLGESGIVVRDPGSAMGMAGGVSTPAGFGVDRLANPVTIGTGAFSLEFWITAGTQANWGTVLYLFDNTAPAFPLAVSIEGTDDGWFVANGCVVFRTPSAIIGSTVSVTDGSPHHVVCLREADGTLRVYVDGIDRSTTTPAPAATSIPAGYIYVGSEIFSRGLVATVQHVAIYTAALSAARVAAHNAAGRTPWDDDLPGTRLGRIFDLAALPAGDRNIGAGTTTLQSTYLGGSALSWAQKVEETELGWLFVARDGKVTFVGRNAAVTGAYLASLATLVDDDSGAGIPYRSGDADVDEGIIVTRATVSREGSIAVTYYDAVAKAEFGWLDETHDGLLHDSDTYSQSYAQWIVNTHKAPSTRVGTVALELTKDPAAMYPAILALELGDRVTYKRKPQNTGAVFTQDMRVEAISHDTGAHYWRTRLQLSPFNLAAGLPVGVWDVTNWDQSVWGI